MNELLDFLLKERLDAADWKDDSGAIVEFAKKARDEYVEKAKELGDPCFGCGEYPIYGFCTSEEDCAKNNYGPGLYCQECMNNG